MQCNFLFFEMKYASWIIIFTESKRNESTMVEKNAYFDTSQEMAPKNDEPQYCNKNVVTPKATNLNYQPRVCTNLRGVGTICATYNVSFIDIT